MSEHPVLEYLKENNNEQDLFEKLLEEVLSDKPTLAIATASKIDALRHLKFSLLKVIKEGEK